MTKDSQQAQKEFVSNPDNLTKVKEVKEVDITDSQATMLLEIDGHVHLVAMNKDSKEVLTELLKRSVVAVVPTGKSQDELRQFLNYTK